MGASMKHRPRGLVALAAVALLTILVPRVARTAPAPDTLPPGPIGDHLRAYVTALNSADPAPALRFATDDLAPDFDQPHPPSAVRGYFEDQRRVTGGIRLVAFRFDDGSTAKGELVFRDAIYGGLRAVAFTFDDKPGRQILDLGPVAAPAWAIQASATQTPGQVASYAAALIDRGCRADVFSGAFLVAHNGRILVQRACGEASKRYHAPNTTGTRIDIGSMNKMFTAVAVAQLVEQGKVKLDDHLSAYLDESWLPKSISDQITIAQLLTMTSGLGSYFDAPFGSFQMNRTLDAYKPVIHAATLSSRPGEKYQYSNTGFFLLGLVVQKASGEDYYDYIRRHIYAPAGMSATDSYELDGPAENLATGYFYLGRTQSWWENRAWVGLKGTPDGGGYSTVGDLLRFAEALKSGKLLTLKSLDLLWRDPPPPSGAGFYGLKGPAGRIVGKDGFGSGVSALMDIYLDRGYVVVALSNYAAGAPAPMEAMRGELAAAK